MTPNELVLQYKGMALNIAWQYMGSGIELDDLRGIACLALVEAAHTWPNPEAERRGITFGAHAATRIKWALNGAVWDAKPVKIRPKGWRKVKALTQAQAERIKAGGGELPTDEELAADLGWTAEQVRQVRVTAIALRDMVSLDTPISGGDDEDDTYAGVIPDASDLEEEMIEKLTIEDESLWLKQAVNSLPPLMRAAISLRFGLPVPNAEYLSAADVLAVADNMSSTHKGLKHLREARRNERGDLPGVVSDNRGTPLGGRKAAGEVKAGGRGYHPEDIWRSYMRDQKPPAFRNERAGAVCAAAQ